MSIDPNDVRQRPRTRAAGPGRTGAAPPLDVPVRMTKDADLEPGPEHDAVVQGRVVDDYEDDEYDEYDDEEEYGPRTPFEVLDDLLHSPGAEAALRHVGHVIVGVVVVRRRRRSRRTSEPYQEAMEAAKALGDHGKALAWAQLAVEDKQARHQRRMDRADAIIQYTPKVAIGTGAGLTVLGVLMAIGEKDARAAVTPWVAVGRATVATVAFASEIWLSALVAAPVIALIILWVVGKSNVETTNIGWVRALNHGFDGEQITPSVVVTAMRDLGIAALRNAIRDMPDGGAAMLSPIRIAGCGVEVEVYLPSGVSTEEVMNRGRKLAENLSRHEHELNTTIPKRARSVNLWIADPGALDEPIGPSPLVTNPNITADYYNGRAPWGQTLRSDPGMVSLFQQHVLITGKSNQGKTASLRALALWLALDPTVQFCIADLKGVGDWGAFDGIASVLIQGPTDDHVMDATHMLEDAVEEMNRRVVALEESGSKEGVTRAMARAPGSGFHPLIIIVDESQKAFMCPAIGSDKRPYGGTKATSRFFNAARELHNQGRAVNVLLWEGTQDPTDANLPRIVRDGAHIRAALYLATRSQAGMALGEAPVEQGAAPHKLRDGRDLGTVVVHGPGIEIPAGQPAVTIRTHYISGEEAEQIADRAKARRAKVATRSAQPAAEQEPRNLLADIDELLTGRDPGERIRLPHLAALLAELEPGYAPYADLTGKGLQEALGECGVRTTTTGNVLWLKPSDFHAAYASLPAGRGGE